MPRRRVWLSIETLKAALDEEDFAGDVQRAADNGNDDRIARMCRRDLGLSVIVVRDRDDVGGRPHQHVDPVWIVLDVPETEDDS
jgi:hypothetical protein